VKYLIVIKRKYNNDKGYFIIPIMWREEFNMNIGEKVGIDLVGTNVIIDRDLNREYIRAVQQRGHLNIPLKLKNKLESELYDIVILYRDKKILLIPVDIIGNDPD
jgi:hypothetical protein